MPQFPDHAQGASGPSSSCVWNPRVFADDARGWQCPFVLCLHPQGCLRRGVLLKSGPGNRGRSACGTTHVARLEFPRETGLILRCAGKVGNPFQTKHGSRPSSRNQEGRSGSDEVVPGTSVFPSRETRVSGNFWNRIKGAKFSHLKCENTSRRNLGLLFRRCSGQGPHLAMTG